MFGDCELEEGGLRGMLACEGGLGGGREIERRTDVGPLKWL
jgi:hypothetical protein